MKVACIQLSTGENYQLNFSQNLKLIRKRLILCHHKHLMIGDYLIDDRRFNGASEFQGKWIHFGNEEYPNWKSVLKYLNIE